MLLAQLCKKIKVVGSKMYLLRWVNFIRQATHNLLFTTVLKKRFGMIAVFSTFSAHMRNAQLLCAGLILAAIVIPANVAAQGIPGKFDYYTLTLSWSPSFCTTPAGRKSPQQCGRERRYAFVVHGLWPQYYRGWPQFCARKAPYIANRLIRSYYDIMPSKRLIIHQWKKHGTCTGLRAADYFTLTRTLFDKIKIPARYLSPGKTILTTPAQVVEDFLKTNKNLQRNMISIQCGNSTRRARLSELRICFGRDGNLKRCGSNETRQCRARQLVLPPVR